jgi:hypothetical protein
MNASHIITAVCFAVLDLGQELEKSNPQVIGAATFTGHVEAGVVTFALHACVITAKDPGDTLIAWLDNRLGDDRTTLAGFDLRDSVRLLEALPMARWSAAVRNLGGRGRTVIDMGADLDGEPVPLGKCCEALQIPCATPDPVRDFTAWCTGKGESVVEALQLDVIAVWRLAMHQIAARSSLGFRVNAVIEGHLATWLRGADFPAAAVHLATLASTPH